MFRTASFAIANKPPTASIGLEPRPSEMPVDHRSGPLPRAIGRSFQDGDGGHRCRSADIVSQCNPRAVHLVDRLPSELREKLHELRHTRGPGRMALRLKAPARIHRQPTADTLPISLDNLVATAPLGKGQIIIADDHD